FDFVSGKTQAYCRAHKAEWSRQRWADKRERRLEEIRSAMEEWLPLQLDQLTIYLTGNPDYLSAYLVWAKRNPMRDYWIQIDCSPQWKGLGEWLARNPSVVKAFILHRDDGAWNRSRIRERQALAEEKQTLRRVCFLCKQRHTGHWDY